MVGKPLREKRPVGAVILPSIAPQPALAEMAIAEPEKELPMDTIFFGLIKQQWQSALRWILTSVGISLAARGVVASDQWAHFAPLVEAAVGALVALGSGAWSLHSNQAKVIISTADQLQGK